ncbi:hypothetical protein HO133_003301 [Letharia lupina]|uniref:DUF7892 domain-containing protein n=1 Tax=Letharia lupina TaxID=560253 RepID=A0A8H6CAV0_9LECA|nr:uncharacterized protein HO133_003301 [Letharia lupina]KAF6220170.1 hypothetical protein HO133_003301 [Letharia lupina]
MDSSPRSTASSDLYSPSESAQPEAAPITNGIEHEVSHKRKREQDPNPNRIMQNRRDFPTVVDSHGSTDEAPSRQADNLMENLSRVKRPRPNGYSIGTGADLSCKSSALPAVHWQHIFCYVPPVFLGRMLSVNHAFNTILTPGQSEEDPTPLPNSIIQPLKAEAIWALSRRRFCPGVPRPIHGLMELEMWKLLKGNGCQICEKVKVDTSVANPQDPWESGPGDTGVRVIWPFGLRCCGPCLQDNTQKELDLSMSSDCPFFLLQGLPFAFISENYHYIGHNVLRSITAPPMLRMTKRYYKPDVEEIKRQFETAKELGVASAEEWTKGLAQQGQQCLEDIIRWEQWDSKGGLKNVNLRPNPKAVISSAKGETYSDRSTPQSMAFSTKSEGDQASPLATSASTPSFQYPKNPPVPIQGGVQHGPQVASHQPRPERNIKDVNEAKAARRAEIERRCAALDPPLLPSVLRHMDSFQAAMQISQPMTDQAWEILRPRLLSQLTCAERREKEQVQQTEILAEEYRQRRQQEAQLKETKENFDREWENYQAPVRHRIGALATEAIESRWAGGKAVTKESSPKFAADVLLDVRQRFYAAVVQEDEAALAAGESVKTDPPNGPPTRKLILENMKWLFDTKIKPLTDHFQRELFLCNGCDGNFKFYGFEGVIQHYAAKHTTALSMGNIVVHWRSEWPEHPPFNPNPSVAKTNYYKIPTPAPPVQVPAVRDPRGPITYGNFVQPVETSAPNGTSQHQTPQYPTVGYQNSYLGPRQEGPPQVLPAQSHPPANSSHIAGVGHSGVQNGYGTSTASYNPFPVAQQGQVAQYGSFPGQQGYPAFPQGQLGTIPQGYFPEVSANNYGGRPTVPYPGNFQKGPLATLAQVHNVPGQVSDLYQRQMDEMAKHAKDVFTGIGGVKDLPGSVRIYVVIQHTVARFKASFPNEPSLSMFIDGLDHNAVMRPVRSVNGLGCRTCMNNGTGAKLYTLPHLVNHFRTAHVETPQMLGHPQAPELDWKHDMIDYPDLSVISKLLNANGMTDAKLSLIALVFPDAFPTPLPNLKNRTNTGPHPMYRKELDANTKGASGAPSKPLAALPSHYGGQSGDQSFNRPHSAFRLLSPGRSSEPLEPPGEDEYDPHRPAYLGKIVKIDTGSTQSHKPVQHSPLQDSHRYLSYTQQEKSNYAMPPRLEDEQTYNSASVSRPKISENYSRESYEPFEHVTQPQSPVPNAMSRSGHRFHQHAGGQAKPSRPDIVNQYDIPVDYIRNYGRTPEDERPGEILSSVKRGAQGVSPPEAVVAADRFLNTLAPETEGARTHKRFSSERDTECASQGQWLSEPPFKRRQQYFGQDGAYDQRSGDEVKVKRQENDILGNHMRTGGSSEPRKSSQAAVPQRSGSHTHYYDGLRPLSQVPLGPVRTGGSPPVRYAPYEDSEQVVVNDRQDMNGSVLKRQRSGSHTYQVSRISQYRDQSASPQRPPAETALYRPRSPVEEDRRDSLYQVRSPSSRRVNRSQRIPNNEYATQTRYEYIDDPCVPSSRHQQRVEYVPIRYEDSGIREPARYVIARPVEQMGPEYVRYESSYAANPVYERNGQVYGAPQRPYQDPYREAPSFAQSHQY